MKLLLDSFWRALAYCLHPKVIGLSLLPLAVGVLLSLGLGWLYWEQAVAGVRAMLESWLLVDAALKWVEGMAGASFRAVLSPLLVVLMAAPVIVVLSVLLVAVLMTPAVVKLVAERRFATLERKNGASLLSSIFWSLGCTLVALLLLVATLPLWLIPPLILVLPPLIWGWLTYQVMSFDTLALHCSRDERRALMQAHRMPLLGMGVVSGYLGAAPSLLWALSAVTVIFAPFIIALSIWLYTLVFAFSALWFAHYGLSALAQMREAEARRVLGAAVVVPKGDDDIVDIVPGDEASARTGGSATPVLLPPAPPAPPVPPAPPGA